MTSISTSMRRPSRSKKMRWRSPRPVSLGAGFTDWHPGSHSGMREGSVMSAKTLSIGDRKSTRLNSSHSQISYAVFCLKKKKKKNNKKDRDKNEQQQASHHQSIHNVMHKHADGTYRDLCTDTRTKHSRHEVCVR